MLRKKMQLFKTREERIFLKKEEWSLFLMLLFNELEDLCWILLQFFGIACFPTCVLNAKISTNSEKLGEIW